MPEQKRFLVDVAMNGLPFPMKVASRIQPGGQTTVATINVSARIHNEFEARWIDKFICVLHQHRDTIGTDYLWNNIREYAAELKADRIRIDYEYPFFIDKLTPVSKHKNLIRYLCRYSSKFSALNDTPKIIFKIDVPVITTDPASFPDKAGGLYGQLSIVSVEVESQKDIYPEDIVDLVEKHALAPVYSFLTPEDKLHLIQKVHSEKKSSVVVTDEIREQLAKNDDITWYAVRCANHGMLHSYSTVVGTEKGLLVPCSSYDEETI